jgi:hypothetical protein
MARPKTLRLNSDESDLLQAAIGCGLVKDLGELKTLLKGIANALTGTILAIEKETGAKLFQSDFNAPVKGLLIQLIQRQKAENGGSDAVRQALRFPHLPEAISVALKDGRTVLANPRMLAEAMRLGKPIGSLSGLVPYQFQETIAQAPWQDFTVDAKALRTVELANAPAPKPKVETPPTAPAIAPAAPAKGKGKK